MDVHYSLPRDIDRAKRCDREKNQVSLFVLDRTDQEWFIGSPITL